MPNSLEQFEAKYGKRGDGSLSYAGWDFRWEAWQAGAAAEQEACAKLCDDIDTHCERYDIDRAFNSSVRRAAKAIRDRSAP